MIDPNLYLPSDSVDISQRAKEPQSTLAALSEIAYSPRPGTTNTQTNRPDLLSALQMCVYIIQLTQITSLPLEAVPLVTFTMQLLPGTGEYSLQSTLHALHQKVDTQQLQVNNLTDARPGPNPDLTPSHHAPYTFAQATRAPAPI
jgi:hypothetical protein